MCETIQDTFYNNFVTGEPLHLVYPPMLDVVSHLPYVFVNETLNIRIPFSSRPEPDDDQVPISPTFLQAAFLYKSVF
jgi:hypothetical protein